MTAGVGLATRPGAIAPRLPSPERSTSHALTKDAVKDEQVSAMSFPSKTAAAAAI
jgi:hypothetical protein